MMNTSFTRLLFFYCLTICVCSCSNSLKKSSAAVDSGNAGKQPWKTGIALYSFNQYPFAETLSRSAGAGAAYVEGFSFHQLGKDFHDKSMGELSGNEIQQMKQMLHNSRLSMPSMFMGAGNLRQWVHYFEMGKQLDMQFLVAEPGREHWDMVDSLAAVYGIKVAIHQHSREHGSRYWHPDSVLTAIRNRPNLGACGDLGHWVRSGLDPVDCLKKLSGRLLSIHLLDVEKYDSQAKSVEAGSGVIDLPAVIRELRRQSFTGFIYVESENAPVQTLQYFNRLAKAGR